MRLIDANELRKHRCEHCAIANNCKNDEDQKIRCWSMKEISYMPTIEAIPIDFIKQTIADKRYILARASEQTAPYYEHAIRALEMLLWEWGKENG